MSNEKFLYYSWLVWKYGSLKDAYYIDIQVKNIISNKYLISRSRFAILQIGRQKTGDTDGNIT